MIIWLIIGAILLLVIGCILGFVFALFVLMEESCPYYHEEKCTVNDPPFRIKEDN